MIVVTSYPIDSRSGVAALRGEPRRSCCHADLLRSTPQAWLASKRRSYAEDGLSFRPSTHVFVEYRVGPADALRVHELLPTGRVWLGSEVEAEEGEAA